MIPMAITVNPEYCPQNHHCPAIRHCPVNALEQKGFQAPEVDSAKCIECRKCIDVCPMGAFNLE